MTTSEIMKKAHALTAKIQKAARDMGISSSYSVTFSECLKLVWAEAKGGAKAPTNAMRFRTAVLDAMTASEKDAYIERGTARRRITTGETKCTKQFQPRQRC